MIYSQLFRFAIIGVMTNLFIYLAYLFLNQLYHAPKLIMTVLYATSVLISFIGNRQWTFSHQGKLSASFRRFLLVYLFGYILNFLILAVCVDRLGYPHEWVQAFAIFIVAACLFILQRSFVFPQVAKEEVEHVGHY